MDVSSIAALIIMSVLVCFVLFSRKRLALTHICGPLGWPFLGNWGQLDMDRYHETLRQWALKYGDIYKFSLLDETVVVVSSEEGIREMLITKSEDFASRPPSFRIDYLQHDSGIIFGKFNEEWSTLKKICMTGLRVVGQGLDRLELVSMDIIESMVKDIQEHQGEPFDCRHVIHNSVASITSLLVLGFKLSKKDLEELIILDDKLNFIAAFLSELSILDKFPWLRHLPSKKGRWLKCLRREALGWYNRQVDRKVASYNEESLDILDLLIKAANDSENTESEKIKINRKHINTVARELIGAGILTTSASLYALVAQWASHPEVQVRAQKVISEVIGSRQVALNDRSSMPYIDSMLMELLRLLSHVPMALPHFTTKDTVLQGKFIPKDTHVWPNLWGMHHDEKLWDEPWSFKADRFLDKDGNLIPADHPLRKRFLAFGAGRRVCAGEVLARNRLFLFAVTLLQRFTFTPSKEGAPIPTDPRKFKLGIVIYPDVYKVKALPRKR